MDRMLRPVHRWVWGDFDRRVRKLLAFAEVEGDGGRDILRAAELTPDPLLRRLYLEHAIDELRHADLFRQRGAALLQLRATRSTALFNANPLPGGHGLDDLSHRRRARPSPARLPARRGESGGRPLRDLSRCRRRRSVDARDLRRDPARRSVPHELHLHAARPRLCPTSYRRQVWQARASRLWKRYLRVAAAVAGVLGTAILTIMYFVVLPPFAWLAKRAERREPVGWTPIAQQDARFADEPVLR